jgi:hypothetical protein
MATPPESSDRDPHLAPNDDETPAPRAPPELVLQPITGPPVVDMTARIEESLRRHEEELATAQRLVEQARSGSAPERPAPITEPAPPPAPGTHRVEFDWRGETAFYVEHDRRVRLSCIYWGGPKGSVSHISGCWEYTDGRAERLTPQERGAVLRAIINSAKAREAIRLAIEEHD